MQIVSLKSGSSGNSMYVKIAEKNLLIDCGTNYKQLNNALLEGIGIELIDINYIFITHRHS